MSASGCGCSVGIPIHITRPNILFCPLHAAAPALLAALERIARNTCCASCQEAALVARAAIQEAREETP